MSRIRPIKPSLAKSEKLYDKERETGLPIRFAVASLILYADRDGRFEWRPRQIKSDVLPYDDCSMEDVLQALVEVGTLIRYRVGGQEYGCFANWHEHQRPRGDERASVLPPPPQDAASPSSRHSDGPVTNPSRHSDELATSTSRTRRATVTDPHQGSGGLEKGSTEDLRKGEGAGDACAPAREPDPDIVQPDPDRYAGVQAIRAVDHERRPSRGRTIDLTKPDREVIQPSEAQLVMLHDRANALGRPLLDIAADIDVPVSGLYVTRLLQHMDRLLAERRPARASPRSIAQINADTTDAALEELNRRRAGCTTN